MKRLSMLALAFALCACVQTPAEKPESNLEAFINGCFFDGADNNDITRASLADTIDTRLARMVGDTLGIITGVPMELETVMACPDDGLSLAKFSVATDCRDCRASLQLFTMVDTETAASLVDGKKYLVQGVFDGIAHEYALPSGKAFTDRTRVSPTSWLPLVTIGTLVLSNPRIEEYEEVHNTQSH